MFWNMNRRWMPYMNEERMRFNMPYHLLDNFEGSQITQVGSIDATPTKDIHHTIDEGSSVTFTGRRNDVAQHFRVEISNSQVLV
jgi:hypothetical protein